MNIIKHRKVYKYGYIGCSSLLLLARRRRLQLLPSESQLQTKNSLSRAAIASAYVTNLFNLHEFSYQRS
jgi:hypothetical protein